MGEKKKDTFRRDESRGHSLIEEVFAFKGEWVIEKQHLLLR